MFSSYNHPFVPFRIEGNIHFWERQMVIGATRGQIVFCRNGAAARGASMTFVMPTTRGISLLTGRQQRLYFPYHIYLVRVY